MTKAKHVAACEAAAAQLAADVFRLAPDRYLTDPSLPARDDTARRWKQAVDTMLDAALELQALGEWLRLKAGIGEPSPFAELVQSADVADFAAYAANRIQARTEPFGHVDDCGEYHPDDFIGTWR